MVGGMLPLPPYCTARCARPRCRVCWPAVLRTRNPPPLPVNTWTASTGPRGSAPTDGILKGISVCTSCVEAAERPPSALAGTEPVGPELHGVPLAALKGQHPLGERRRPPPSLASLAAKDLVDMSTDDLKERYKRTVTMAGMMAYTLTEDGEEELPVTGAWTMIKKRELASLRVCCAMYVMYVPVFCLPTRLWRCFRLFCAFAA